MNQIPQQLKYTASHEWLREEKDGTLIIGITAHAQELLGDLVFVELPTPGETVVAGDEIAVVESVKAASDVYSPVSGEVVSINLQLADRPELVNQEPYMEGWLFKLKPSNAKELESLLDAATYQQQIGLE